MAMPFSEIAPELLTLVSGASGNAGPSAMPWLAAVGSRISEGPEPIGTLAVYRGLVVGVPILLQELLRHLVLGGAVGSSSWKLN